MGGKSSKTKPGEVDTNTVIETFIDTNMQQDSHEKDNYVNCIEQIHITTSQKVSKVQEIWETKPPITTWTSSPPQLKSQSISFCDESNGDRVNALPNTEMKKKKKKKKALSESSLIQLNEVHKVKKAPSETHQKLKYFEQIKEAYALDELNDVSGRPAKLDSPSRMFGFDGRRRPIDQELTKSRSISQSLAIDLAKQSPRSSLPPISSFPSPKPTASSPNRFTERKEGVFPSSRRQSCSSSEQQDFAHSDDDTLEDIEDLEQYTATTFTTNSSTTRSVMITTTPQNNLSPKTPELRSASCTASLKSQRSQKSITRDLEIDDLDESIMDEILNDTH